MIPADFLYEIDFSNGALESYLNPLTDPCLLSEYQDQQEEMHHGSNTNSDVAHQVDDLKDRLSPRVGKQEVVDDDYIPSPEPVKKFTAVKKSKRVRTHEVSKDKDEIKRLRLKKNQESAARSRARTKEKLEEREELLEKQELLEIQAGRVEQLVLTPLKVLPNMESGVKELEALIKLIRK